MACYSQLARVIPAGQAAVECIPINTVAEARVCLPQVTSSSSKMITPAFELSQEPDYLILSIRVPYTRTSEFDLYIDGTDFKFYAKPYFLR